jgi:hypothetical protein
MDFPRDILDIRKIHSFETIDLNASNKWYVKLTLNTIVSEENFDNLKSILIGYNIIPSKFFTIGKEYYEVKGNLENICDFSINLQKSTIREKLDLFMNVSKGKEEESKILFEVIKTYLDLTSKYTISN